MLKSILSKCRLPGFPGAAPGDTTLATRRRDFFDTAVTPIPPAEQLRYPPIDTGIPSSVTPKEVVSGHAELIERIYRTAGASREDFSIYYLPAIDNLAAYTHALPATAGAYYRGAGGLLRMSLEIGLYSLQSANATIFPIAGGVERRHVMHPKWCLGAFLAGICSQLYRAVSHVAVITTDGNQWPALRSPLYNWVSSLGVENYYVRWLEEPNGVAGRAAGTFAVPLVIPANILQYLSDDNHHVLGAMASAIAGADVYSRENAISRIVAPILARIIDDDVRRSPLNYGHMTVGMHLEPHLIDAMRQLVREGAWQINTDKAVIWTGSDGTYLRWSQAVNDLQTIMNRDGFSGVPRDPDVLAGILIKAGVLETRDPDTTSWTIILPDSGEVVEGAVKLSQPDLLFAPNVQFIAGNWVLMAPASKPSAKSANPEATAAPSVITAVTRKADESARDEASTVPAPAAVNEPKLAPTTNAMKTEAGALDAARPAGGKAPSPTADGSSAAGTPQSDADLVDSLKPGNAWLLGEIVKAYKEGRLTGRVIQLTQGVGISQDELSAHGQQLKDFVDELKAKQWLWVDLKNPSRHLHRLPEEDASVRWLILRPDVARRIGLKD